MCTLVCGLMQNGLGPSGHLVNLVLRIIFLKHKLHRMTQFSLVSSGTKYIQALNSVLRTPG